MQAGADRDTAGVRAEAAQGGGGGTPKGSQVCEKRRGLMGGRRSGRVRGDRQNPDGHALGRLEFICCTSLALVYKEKTQPTKTIGVIIIIL